MVATRLGHKVHGTIGVLIRAIRRSQMRSEEVIKKLTQIQSHSTLHIKYSLLEEIIARVKRIYSLNETKAFDQINQTNQTDQINPVCAASVAAGRQIHESNL